MCRAVRVDGLQQTAVQADDDGRRASGSVLRGCAAGADRNTGRGNRGLAIRRHMASFLQRMCPAAGSYVVDAGAQLDKRRVGPVRTRTFRTAAVDGAAYPQLR